MPVIVTADVAGQTREAYDGMLAVLAPAIRRAPGFILHTAYRSDDQWKVVEVWDSKLQADAFFARYVAPNLPAGVRPKRRVHEVEGLVTEREPG